MFFIVLVYIMLISNMLRLTLTWCLEGVNGNRPVILSMVGRFN